MRKLLMCLLICAIVLVASMISRTNTVSVKTSKLEGADIVAIQKVSHLVTENFLDRDYYEAMTYTESGPLYFVNYNKAGQALLISNDAFSGWSYYFYASPQQVKMVADKKIPVTLLHNYLERIPLGQMRNWPTRSMDVIPLF